MKACFVKIKRMEKVGNIFLKVLNSKDHILMANLMEEESSFGKMENFMMVNGTMV